MKNKNLESRFKEKADKLYVGVRPKLWDKLEKRMDDHYASTTPAEIVNREWMRYAAAMLLLVGAGFIFSKIGSIQNNAPTVHNFVIEEINQTEEADKTYEEMVEFSHKYYRTLINPGAKEKTPL